MGFAARQISRTERLVHKTQNRMICVSISPLADLSTRVPIRRYVPCAYAKRTAQQFRCDASTLAESWMSMRDCE
jgi:hypothetical protein